MILVRRGQGQGRGSTMPGAKERVLTALLRVLAAVGVNEAAGRREAVSDARGRRAPRGGGREVLPRGGVPVVSEEVAEHPCGRGGVPAREGKREDDATDGMGKAGPGREREAGRRGGIAGDSKAGKLGS